jgi:hypothetical protein
MSVPLAWLGFNPALVGLAFTINLMYQFWIHTEARTCRSSGGSPTSSGRPAGATTAPAGRELSVHAREQGRRDGSQPGLAASTPTGNLLVT